MCVQITSRRKSGLCLSHSDLCKTDSFARHSASLRASTHIFCLVPAATLMYVFNWSKVSSIYLSNLYSRSCSYQNGLRQEIEASFVSNNQCLTTVLLHSNDLSLITQHLRDFSKEVQAYIRWRVCFNSSTPSLSRLYNHVNCIPTAPILEAGATTATSRYPSGMPLSSNSRSIYLERLLQD